MSNYKRIIPGTIEEMIELRNRGYSNVEIAKMCGCAYVTVWKRIGPQPKVMTLVNRQIGMEHRSRKINARKEQAARMRDEANEKIRLFNSALEKIEAIRANRAELIDRMVKLQAELADANTNLSVAEGELDYLRYDATKAQSIATIKMKVG